MSEITNTATIRVVADASGVATGLRPAVEAARDASAAVSEVGTSSASAAQTVEASQGRMTAAVQRSTSQIEASERNLVNMVQRMTASTQAGARSGADFVESLARIRGVDPSGALAPYLAQLRAVEQAQARTAASAGASAGQIAAAMRTVPAQFTDIVTALQGGQRPLTVLLQQGGQLRDQFGSTGVAARALGSYILGLVNPYTLAAGAAIALGFAYKSGAEEAAAYAKALALTGNAAGATADQLNEMARQIGAVSGNRGAAAEAITALTSTGQVSVDNLKQFGKVAADVQRDIGRSVADTAKDFADLGRTPLASLTKLNDQYHFITAATYAQVKALQDQGRAQEAAEVAQKAYAEAINGQRQKVLDSLTDWERGWIRIKNAVSGAVDSVIDFASGRGATNSEKIKSLLQEREDIEENMRRARARGLTADEATYQAELDANQRAINAIRDKGKATKDAAKAQADAAQITQAHNKWLDDGDKYLTRAAQLQRDLTKAENEGKAAHASQAEIDQRLAAIRQSYSDIYNAGIDSNIAALKRRDQVQDVLEQRELARIAASRAAGSMNEDDAINATADAEVAAFNRKRAVLEAELELTKKKANSIKEQKDLLGQIDVLDEQQKNRQIQRTNDLFAAEQRRYRQAVNNSADVIEKEMAELTSLRQQTQAQLDYNDAIGLTQKQVAELTAERLREQAARKESDAIVAEGLDLTGERAQRIRDEAAAIRERADALVAGADKQQRIDQWKQAVDQYGQVFQQGFADMLNNGEAGWKSFTKSLVTTFKTSVADQIYKMFARPFVVQMVGSLLGVSQTAIAGEIASQQPLFGGSAGAGEGGTSAAISAAQTASSLYKAINGGFDSLSDSVAGAVQTGLSKLGYNPMASQGLSTASGQALTPFASYAGQAASMLGSYALGSGINKLISGQYQVGSGFQTTEKIATAVASYFGPVAGSIAGAVSGLINRAFGMGNKEVTSQGISGTLTASSLSGQNYTSWHQDGGWFRSDKNGTDTAALTAATVAQFTQGLAAIESASSGFAKSLGVSADWIASYSKTFDIKLTGDATKDQQAITDFFSGIGDEIANKLVPNLADFEKYGETASAALERLAGDFQATDQIAQLIGKSAADAFGTAGIESAKAREQLITLAGSASTLTSQAQSYAQNFLTDAEKLAPVQKALDDAMASLGLSTVQTRDQFKAIVNSLDLTTEAGAKEFTSLMALADAFAQVHPATDAAAEALAQTNKTYQDQIDELLKATMTADQVRAMETAGMDASTVALYDRLAALKAEASANEAAKAAADKAAQDAIAAAQQSAADYQQKLDSARSALSSAYQRESSALTSVIDKAKQAAQALRDYSSSLALGSMSTLSLEQKYQEAKRQFEQAAPEQMQAAAQAFLEASKQYNASTPAYVSDYAEVQKALAQAITFDDQQADIASQQLDALNLSVAGISQVNDSVMSVRDALKQYLDLVANPGAASGTTSTIAGASGGPLGSSLTNPISSLGLADQQAALQGIYQSVLGRSADADGLAFWMNAISQGATYDSITAAFKQSQEYQSKQMQILSPAVMAKISGQSTATTTTVDLAPAVTELQALVAEAKADKAQRAAMAEQQQEQADALADAVAKLTRKVEAIS